MFKQFDIVQIITTKRITYVSGPQGHAASPNFNWSIVGFINSEALLARDSTLVKVPLEDIRKIGDFNVENLVSKIVDAGNVHKNVISVSEYVSKRLKITIEDAKKFLIDYNFKLFVDSIKECDAIAERAEILWLRKNKN